MSLESGLRDYVLADKAVKAIIGDKFFPHEAPQDVEEPFLVYRLGDAEEPRTLTGARVSRKRTYEIICCETSFDGADELRAAVRNAIGGEESVGVETDLAGIDVIMFWSEHPERYDHISGPDRPRHSVALELVVLVK